MRRVWPFSCVVIATIATGCATTMSAPDRHRAAPRLVPRSSLLPAELPHDERFRRLVGQAMALMVDVPVRGDDSSAAAWLDRHTRNAASIARALHSFLVRHPLVAVESLGVSALLLEDLAALNPGTNWVDVTAECVPENPVDSCAQRDLAEVMRQSWVSYSALAAQQYTECRDAARRRRDTAWGDFCDWRRRRMLLISLHLPDCASPSVLDRWYDAYRQVTWDSVRPRTARVAAVLASERADAPLFVEELERVAAAIRDSVGLPSDMRWLSAQEMDLAGRLVRDGRLHESGPVCRVRPTIADVLDTGFASPAILALRSTCESESSSCALAANPDYATSHRWPRSWPPVLRSEVRGAPIAIDAWMDAARHMTTQGGVGRFHGRRPDDAPAVEIEQIGAFGPGVAGVAAQLQSSASALEHCRGPEPEEIRVLVQFAPTGEPTRVEATRFLGNGQFHLDVPNGGAVECVTAMARTLTASRSAGERRVMFTTRLNALGQPRTEPYLPLAAVRSDDHLLRRYVNQQWDRFDRRLGDCMGGDEPYAGLCFAVAPDGRTTELVTGRILGPDDLARPLLDRERGDDADVAADNFGECARQALSDVGWPCTESGSPAHVALSIGL